MDGGVIMDNPGHSFVDIHPQKSSETLDSMIQLQRKREKKVEKLTEIEVVAIISVLEDVYYQLCIVGCPEAKYLTEFSEPLYRTIEERVNSLFQVTVIDGCELLRGEIEDTVPVLHNHTKKNCIYLIKTMDETIQDLMYKGTYEHLQDYVIVPYFIILEEYELVEVLNKRLGEIVMKQKDLKYFHEINSTSLAKEACLLQQTKGYFARLREFIKKETIYVDKWETCRRNQLSRRLKTREERANKALFNHKRECDAENYAHIVIMDYLGIVIKGIKHKLKEFEYRRMDDMHQLDDKLEIVKFRGRQVRKEVTDSSGKHNNLDRKIRKIKRIMMEDKAARIIQNWWRAVKEAKDEREKREKLLKKGKGKKGKVKGKGKENEEKKEGKRPSVKKSSVDPLGVVKEEKPYKRKKSRAPSFSDSPVLSYEQILRVGKLDFPKPSTFPIEIDEPPPEETQNPWESEQSDLRDSITSKTLTDAEAGDTNQLLADVLGGGFIEGDKNPNKSITVNMATVAKEGKPFRKGIPPKIDTKVKQTRNLREQNVVPKQNVQKTMKKIPFK